ncbi:hypothetical protein D3C85_765940 [compost metagenome]
MHYFMEKKPTKVRTLINHVDTDFKKNNPKIKLVNIESDLKSTRKKILDVYNKDLENQKVILEEAIKLSISLHNLNKSLFSEEHYAHTFVVLSANIINISLGIKDNLQNGLLNCAKVLYRTLIESIHIFQASLFDDELRDRFMNLEMYDNNDFYFENFSKNKLFNKCTDFYKSLEIEDKKIEYLIERKKTITKFLSESVHSSYNAAHSNYITMTLDFGISNDYYDKITIGYPKILASLIEDLVIYNTVYKTYIEKNLTKFNAESDEFILYNFYSDKFDLITSLYLDDFFLETDEVNKEIQNIKRNI